jgi:signal transduction histidine kinase
MGLKKMKSILQVILLRLSRLSLKGRLAVAFSGLMFFAMWFAFALMFRQHQMAVEGGGLAVSAHEAMSVAIQARESLSEIERKVSIGEFPQSEVDHFNRLIVVLSQKFDHDQSKNIINKIQETFGLYVGHLLAFADQGEAYSQDHRELYEEVAAAVGSYVEMNENSVYNLAENLQEQQERAMQFAMILLFGFMFLGLVASFRVISYITNPISNLVRVVDDLNLEEDPPMNLPKLNTEIPEVGLLARSFERLFQRLRGYRALNIRRLLIEKRRADIIAASISDGIFLLRGNEIIYVNPIAERILGLPPSGFSKLNKQQQVSEIQNKSGFKAVMDAVSRTLPVEFSLETEERKYHYLIQSFPISYDLIEKIEHSVGGSVEEILEKFQANTLVLAQDVSLVRESQEAKSHFLATLSHEVKTPVTSLTMATRLLKKSIDQFPNPTHKSLITTCADDVDRLRILLEDLLNVSRFDTLAQNLEIQKIDLGKLLNHSVQSFQLQAKERGIELILQVINHGKPLVVAMDATKVAWALSNLMTNALRHTPRGGRVDVKLEAFEEWAEVRVRDTGAGIDRHRQERIFDKFNPYYDLRIARSGSVGAGLAIAREIVTAHGGRIWVVSEPGHGAEFCFTLPTKRTSTAQYVDDSMSRQVGQAAERTNGKNRFSF